MKVLKAKDIDKIKIRALDKLLSLFNAKIINDTTIEVKRFIVL